jgi:hypothetical protein
MKFSPKLLLALAFTLSFGVRVRSQNVPQGQISAHCNHSAPAISSILDDSKELELGLPLKVTHFATSFDGDHSLEETIVVEQASAQYSLYTVRLHFASGAEQSFAIAAPPGGLQPELRDMSGDNVPNDVVLTSRLLGLPFIVLLNEGPDHLTVAISTGSFASDDGRASGPGQVHHTSALPVSGFRPGSLVSGGGTILPELQENLFSTVASLCIKHAEHRAASGRAPPAPVVEL